MLTRNGVNSILGRIMETGGMTADMEKDIERLKDEFDEREGILRRYGEAWDEDAEEYDWKEKQVDESGAPAKLAALQSKYDELVERYKARFFAGGDTHETDEELVPEENDTVNTDTDEGSPTIDDILVDIDKKEE